MEVLNSIVNSLNKEEVRNFKLWLNSTNASSERKDVQLFDYMRSSGEGYNEDFIFKKLYGKADKNSFYRLKNRLLDDIGYNLTTLHFDKQEANNLYHFLSLYNIFTSRNQPDLALHYLKKAEKRALQAENFELLDIIYANYVKISGELGNINPEVYIQKRKANAANLNRIRETDQVLAAVTYRLKLGQNYGKRDAGLLKLLDNTIKEFAEDEEIKQSKIFQTRVFRAVSQILVQNHSYEELEKFMLATYKRFVQQKWFDKGNHETKLQMLIYLINALFKNKKYTESLDYAETLGEELGAFNSMLYDKFMFFYYNALMLNYAQIDIKRGLKALDELEKEMKGKKNTYYEFFVHLNRANLLFFTAKYNDALRSLVKLYLNDHYKKADTSFKLKIAIAECIMQYESGDRNLLKKRIEQVRKEYAGMLAQDDYKREAFVLTALQDMQVANALEEDKKLLMRLKKFSSQFVKPAVEDSEVIRYRAWLAPKVGVQV